MMVEKKAKLKAATSTNLLQLLAEIDEDKSGHITIDELNDSFQRPDIRAFMDAMEIDVDEAQSLFTLLDSNDDGTVDIAEFVDGMSKLKGDARSLDIHMLIMQGKKTNIVFNDMIRMMQEQGWQQPRQV